MRMKDRMPNTQALPKLREILSHSGVRAAIIFMNNLTDQRFTALYRFSGEMLKNLHFFDRENPLVESCTEIPVLASYCVFVRDTQRRFVLGNSIEDERTIGHSKRLEIKSYCGVPLLDRDGKMFGTVCHFDVCPHVIPQVDVDLMENLADILSRQMPF